MEVIGKVKLIGEVQAFGANGFRKRELVVTTVNITTPEDHMLVTRIKFFRCGEIED